MEPAPFSSVQFADWLSRVEGLERVIRVGAATAFGLALVVAALHLLRSSRGSSGSPSESHPILFWRRYPQILPRLSHVLYVLGTVLVGAQLALVFALPDVGLPATMGLGLVVLVVTAVLAVDFDRDRLPAFTFVTSSLAWLVLVLTPLLDAPTAAVHRTPLSLLGRFHIAAAIVAQALFVLACATSIIYIFAHRRLRQKRLIARSGLPSLDSLDRLIDRAHVLGLLVMTASLVGGLVMTYQGFALAGDGLLKLIWAFGVWLWYVVALFGRVRLGWRGYRGALVSVGGAVLLGLALFGTVWGA